MHVVGHFRALCSVLAFSEHGFFLLPKYPVVVTYQEDLYRCQGLSQFSSLATLSLFVQLILNIGEKFQLHLYIYKYFFFPNKGLFLFSGQLSLFQTMAAFFVRSLSRSFDSSIGNQ